METYSISATSNFTRALRNAYLFTYHGRVPRPMIECVELNFQDGEVTIVATDSYALYTEVLAYDGPAEKFTATIDRVQAKAIADWLKGKSSTATVFTPDTATNCLVNISWGNSLFQCSGVVTTFPDWRRLLPTEDPTGPGGVIAFTSNMLARLAKVEGGVASKRENEHVRFDFWGETKAARAVIGNATCWQMPYRVR